MRMNKMSLRAILFRLKFKRFHQLQFLDILFRLGEEGVPARDALIALRAFPDCKLAAQRVIELLGEGETLGRALEPVLDNDLAGYIAALEHGENFNKQGLAIIKNMKAQGDDKMRAIKELITPAISLLVAIAVVVYLSIELFPLFEKLQPLDRWDPIAKKLYNIGLHLQDAGLYYLLTLATSTLAIYLILPHWHGSLRRLLDQYYPLNLSREYLSGRLQQQMALRLQSGLILNEAFKEQASAAQGHERMYINLIQARQGQGVDQGLMMDVGLLHPGDMAQLKALAAHKGFYTALERLGQAALERSSKRIATALKPIRLLLMGVAGVILMSIAHSIFTMGQIN